ARRRTARSSPSPRQPPQGRSCRAQGNGSSFTSSRSMGDPRTLTELFFGAMDRAAARPVVLRYKRRDAWEGVSGAAVLERVQDVSLGLCELGVAPGDRVAILSENRPEWAFADYACLALRAADVPIYPTLPPKQIEYILRDSGAVAVFVSTKLQLD